MDDSLINPIQSEEEEIRVNSCPQRYYQKNCSTQRMTFEDGKVIPIKYDRALPFIPIWRPRKEEIHHCRHLPMNSKDSWDPFLFDRQFITLIHDVLSIHMQSFALQSRFLFGNSYTK